MPDIRAKENMWKSVLKNLLWFALVGAVAFCFTKFVIINAFIPSESMENTLQVGDFVMGNRLARNYERGDILIFKFNDEEYFIKRLIGLPGDDIEIKDHAVYVNGEKLDEPYLKEQMETPEEMSFHVPEGSYFMMGDNRNESYDSRYWDDPYIKKDQIVARAVFRFWPIKNAEFVK